MKKFYTVAVLLAGSSLNCAAYAQSTENSRGTELGEIVVTASKRSERVLDVPTAITAFRGADLLNKGYSNLSDYLTLTPGVQMNQGLGQGTPVIRGLNTGQDSGPLVGVVADGAPVSPSATWAGGGKLSLNIDPIDLERVEVLKGPQGTLYGANTLGGLISYVLAKPDLETVTGAARGELSTTEGGGVNYSMRAAVSAPIAQGKAGVRLSGYVDRPNGYIDNDVTGVDNQNKQRNWGIAGSLLFAPTSALTIKLDGFYQRTNLRALNMVIYGANGQPRDGGLEYNDYLYPRLNKTVKVGIANVDYDLGFAKLGSITSYQKSRAQLNFNGTGAFGPTVAFLSLLGGVPLPPPGLVSLDENVDLKKFTQEVRLTSSGDGPLQYVAGLFYTRESAIDPQGAYGRQVDYSKEPTLDPAFVFDLRSKYKEVAGFANVTYKFSDQFDLTGGIRVGKITQTFRQLYYGSDAAAFNVALGLLGAAPTPADTGTTKSSDTIKTYLATARYHFSRDGMVYARFATGFRPGGPNASLLGLPPGYDADQTQNYEAGIKSKFLDGRATIEAAGYYMKWKDILIGVGAGGISGLTNGGDARVYGAEGTLTVNPVEGFNLIGTISYSDAKIDKVDPAAATSAAVGDPLPNTPRWSGSLSANYRTPVSADWSAVFDATAKFVGSRHAYLRSSTLLDDWVMPSYALFDVRAGMESERINVDLFIRNLTNKRAQLAAQTNFGLNEIAIQRPRTFGASVSFKY